MLFTPQHECTCYLGSARSKELLKATHGALAWKLADGEMAAAHKAARRDVLLRVQFKPLLKARLALLEDRNPSLSPSQLEILLGFGSW